MIDTFIAFLKTKSLTPTVQHAFTSKPIENYTDDVPTILVYPGNRSVSEGNFDLTIVQEQTKEIECILVCKISDFETLIAELHTAALGWDFDQYHVSLQTAGGETMDVLNNYLWWRETYYTSTQIRES